MEVEGHGTFPPDDDLWNVMMDFQVRYRYANGVQMFYVGRRDDAERKDYAGSQAYMRFEGTEGWVCGWYGPDRLEAEQFPGDEEANKLVRGRHDREPWNVL